MAAWLLLLLALIIQGHSLGDQRNETNISGNSTTQLKSIRTTSSTVLRATTGSPTDDSPTSPVYSSTTIPSISTSIPKTENKITTKAPQTTTGPIPETTATTTNSSVQTTANEDRNLPKFTSIEKKVTSPLPILRIFSTNSTTSRITTAPTTILHVTTETSTNQNHIDDRKQPSPKTEYSSTEGITTENIQDLTNTPEVDPSDGEWSTTTEMESDWELETSTPEESSTLEDGITESTELATENAYEDKFSTTDLPDDTTTTDSSLEYNNEDSYEELSSFRTTHDHPKTENHASLRIAPCPPGRAGLACRRAEARRTADECSGGNCEKCRSCNNTAATDWPHCCRKNFRCCSELALACQQCDQPTLQEFCTMHFKRCF